MAKVKYVVNITASLEEATKGIALEGNTVLCSCNDGVWLHHSTQGWIRPQSNHMAIRLWNVENKELGLSDSIEFGCDEFIQDWIDLFDDYRVLVGSQKDLYGAISDIKKDFIGHRKFHIACSEGEFDNVIVSVNKDGTWAYVA